MSGVKFFGSRPYDLKFKARGLLFLAIRIGKDAVEINGEVSDWA